MADLREWNVEDDAFWNSTGKKVANRNLWISIPCLLVGFSTWLMWGIIAVQMLNIGFPFSKVELFTITSIAGLTGATLRIPSSFMIRIAGGRNTIFYTTSLMLIPAIGAGIALQTKETPLIVFQILAFLSGFGGGNFASSMSNISFFFPKRVQGTSLGLNAGLGNFGVTTMQILVPLVMTFALLGPISGDPMTLINTSGTLIGKIPAGTATWISNAGWVWVLWLVPLGIASWFGMNNITDDHVSPGISNPIASMAKITYLLITAFICAGIALYLMLPPPIGLGVINMWIAMGIAICGTLILMRFATPAPIRENLKRQFRIFSNSHTWIMTIIYTMTFGSFIGFSASFPLSIKVIFGFKHVADASGVMTHTMVNPNGPSALTYAWMGPFIGALIRPVGGWIADKLGGALVTQICSIAMVIGAFLVGGYMLKAYGSATPEEYFMPFFLLFLLLFLASGIGNGSTFRTIAMVFDKEQAGPVLGWTSSVAAYGAFFMPKLIGAQIKLATPHKALWGFAVFYAVCCVLNYLAYLRPGCKYKNP